MPLSEHEQRLLDEIEQTLRSDDPALASSLRSARPTRRLRTIAVLAAACLAVGIVLLVAGLRLHGTVATILAVVGFVFLVGAGDLGLRVTHRVRSERGSRPDRTRRTTS
jgi:hypothetical protein